MIVDIRSEVYVTLQRNGPNDYTSNVSIFTFTIN